MTDGHQSGVLRPPNDGRASHSEPSLDSQRIRRGAGCVAVTRDKRRVSSNIPFTGPAPAYCAKSSSAMLSRPRSALGSRATRSTARQRAGSCAPAMNALCGQAGGPRPNREPRSGAANRFGEGAETRNVEAERFVAVLLDLAETVDLRFSGSARHSETVGRYAEMMAQSSGCPSSTSPAFASGACSTTSESRRPRRHPPKTHKPHPRGVRSHTTASPARRPASPTPRTHRHPDLDSNPPRTSRRPRLPPRHLRWRPHPRSPDPRGRRRLRSHDQRPSLPPLDRAPRRARRAPARRRKPIRPHRRHRIHHHPRPRIPLR